MAKPDRLDDEQLAYHARQSAELRAAARQAEKDAKEHVDKVLAEVAARKKTVEEVAGVRITVKTSKRQLDLETARATLSRRLFAGVTRSSIDRKAWDAAKAAGKITDATELACTVEVDVTPHIYVNEIAAA